MRTIILLLLALAALGGLAAAAGLKAPSDNFFFHEGLADDSDEGWFEDEDLGFGEGRSLLQAYSAQPSQAQADTAVVNSLRCGDYWKASMPSGSAGPNAAFRLGMRDVTVQIGRELGVRRPAKLMRAQSVLCQNPVGAAARGRRLAGSDIVGGVVTAKRIRAGVTVKINPVRQAAFLAKLAEKYADGSYVAAVRARMPAQYQMWFPYLIHYKNGASATCDPKDFASHCPGQAWDPSKANIQQ